MSLATPAGALALNGLCERVLSCSSRDGQRGGSQLPLVGFRKVTWSAWAPWRGWCNNREALNLSSYHYLAKHFHCSLGSLRALPACLPSWKSFGGWWIWASEQQFEGTCYAPGGGTWAWNISPGETLLSSTWRYAQTFFLEVLEALFIIIVKRITINNERMQAGAGAICSGRVLAGKI